MAPNLKRLSVLSQSLSNLQIVRPKDALLQYQAPTPLFDSSSYWEWSEPTDLFSADHVTANLRSTSKLSSASAPTSTIQAQNDDYWAEESSSVKQDNVSIEPLHLADSMVYFAEASYDGSIPSYWVEAVAPVHHCSSNECASVQHDYWNEAVHTPTSDSDTYWAEESDALAASQRRYWNWQVDTCTRRDCYWIM
jgi:hypothetical protein